MIDPFFSSPFPSCSFFLLSYLKTPLRLRNAVNSPPKIGPSSFLSPATTTAATSLSIQSLSRAPFLEKKKRREEGGKGKLWCIVKGEGGERRTSFHASLAGDLRRWDLEGGVKRKKEDLRNVQSLKCFSVSSFFSSNVRMFGAVIPPFFFSSPFYFFETRKRKKSEKKGAQIWETNLFFVSTTQFLLSFFLAEESTQIRREKGVVAAL